MNIIHTILTQFFLNEKSQTIMIIMISFILNFLQSYGISSVSALLINSLKPNNMMKTNNIFYIFVAISVIYIIFYAAYKLLQNKLLTTLRQWIRQQFVNMLLTINNEKMSNINFTQLASPINRISSVVFMGFTDLILYILPNVVFVIMVCLYLFYYDVTLGTMFMIGNLSILLYLFFVKDTMLDTNHKYEKSVNETETYLQEILNNIDKIIYRGQVDTEIDNFADKTKTSTNDAYDFYYKSNNYGLVMTTLVYLTMFAIVWYLITMFYKKNMNSTEFITIFTIIILYREKLATIIQQIPDMVEFIGRSNTVITRFEKMGIHYLTAKNNYKPVDLPFNTFQFKDVCFKYSPEQAPIFDKFNMTLDTNNKIIGITGLSGNGKSTFIKLLLKLYKCDSGKIYIDNTDITTLSPDYIRENITYVNQNSKLFDKKIIDNMLYGCSDIDVCKENLEKVMKHDKIKELYRKLDIYNDRAGSLGDNLSGGQRQIVNVISGLVNPSKILVLDEPTNALDPALKQDLIQIIDDFRKERKCIIIITHDKDVYPLFDKRIEL
jgi:ABC-type bacteriocin/lantibiotic exporter with double-glycine peptidase domain